MPISPTKEDGPPAMDNFPSSPSSQSFVPSPRSHALDLQSSPTRETISKTELITDDFKAGWCRTSSSKEFPSTRRTFESFFIHFTCSGLSNISKKLSKAFDD